MNSNYKNRENTNEEEFIPQARSTQNRFRENENVFKNSIGKPNPMQSSQQSFISTTNLANNNVNFIPCINCNNIISIEDIGKQK